ncbi:hypothetical protein D915_001527 [Fasciola hepatica]|uniref:Saposin B-type domain-containing protein n=1 Tax=Fasciola hepatica TaxID=6192 RepID=A0A4E0RPT7_FASHE|nr:hypothetical protein D915_001527 [Fasciola hepatica]
MKIATVLLFTCLTLCHSQNSNCPNLLNEAYSVGNAFGEIYKQCELPSANQLTLFRVACGFCYDCLTNVTKTLFQMSNDPKNANCTNLLSLSVMISMFTP